MNNAIESYEAIPAIHAAHSILTENFKNTVADIVVGYEAEKLSGTDNYKRMVQVALDSHCYDKASYLVALLPGELEVLEFRKLQGENVQTKTGKWKMSKVCTNSTYSSTKAVIAGALDLGISLTDDDGNIKGKSALESEIKEGKPEKTPEEKVSTAFSTFINLYDKCNDETRQAYAKLMREHSNEELNKDQPAPVYA